MKKLHKVSAISRTYNFLMFFMQNLFRFFIKSSAFIARRLFTYCTVSEFSKIENSLFIIRYVLLKINDFLKYK